MSVWTGPCDALQCVAGNDDRCGTQSEVSWDSNSLTDYIVYVHGFRGASGNFMLDLSGQTNEEGCNAALPLPIGSIFGGNTETSRSYNAEGCGVTNDVISKGSWFRTTGNGGMLIIYTCFNTEFDTMVGFHYDTSACSPMKVSLILLFW